MQTLQLLVETTTIVITILAALLAYSLTKKYFEERNHSYFFWSFGLWLFAIATLIEAVFAYGVYNDALIKSYLFIVGMLVLSLSVGSIELTHSKKIKTAYYAFSIIATVLLFYSLLVSNIGNVLQNYVVFGNLPLLVIETSSLITFPAALVLVLVAANSYRKTKSNKMLSIIVGVIVVSIAGTLYIASYPEFLYISEFLGILLLWYGFRG